MYNIDFWENGLISKGLSPIFEIIEITNEEKWMDREIFWIKKLKMDGCHLLNMTNGGDSINVPITKNHI